MDGTKISSSQGAGAPATGASPAGAVRLAFRRVGESTRLAGLEQRHPLRALMPDAVDDAIPMAVLANTSGGVVGGDRLEVHAEVETGASVMLTTQAAEKIYRSAGPMATISNRLIVGQGAWLEWLPHETILFDGARLQRRLCIDLADSCRLMAGEIVVFGRESYGERVTHGHLHDVWEVRRGGRLIWYDATRLDDDIALSLADPMRFASARAIATMVYAGGDAAAMLPRVRAWLSPAADAAATQIDQLLIVRFLSGSASRLRRQFAALWPRMRAEAGGLPKRLPRIWNV